MLHGKDYFAELRSFFEISMRRGRLRQRKNTIDGGLETARSHQLHDRQKLRFGSHVRPKQRKLAAEQKPQVNLGVITGCGAASYQATTEGQAGHTFVPRRGAHMFKHYVHPALVCDAPYFIADFLALVVDDMVGTQFARFRQLFIRSGRGNDAGGKELSDLYRRAADAASCSENQHVFTWL